MKICEQREVEFFRRQAAQEPDERVREIQDSNWKSFAGSDLQAGDHDGGAGGEAIAIRRLPVGHMFKPKSWNKARRYVMTPIVDKDDQQVPGRRAAPVA